MAMRKNTPWYTHQHWCISKTCWVKKPDMKEPILLIPFYEIQGHAKLNYREVKTGVSEGYWWEGVWVEGNSSATVSLQTCMSLHGPCGKAWAVWHESWHNALQLLTEQGDISSLERNLLTLSCGRRTPGHFSSIFLLSVEFRAFHRAPPQRIQPRLYSFLAVVWSWLLSHRVTYSHTLCHPVIWSFRFIVILGA